MDEGLRLLYDDDDHGVLLKRAGISTHGRGSNTLSNALHVLAGGELWMLVHRLDFGTQGPVLFAKHKAAHRKLQSQWPQFTKTYHAWVAGRLETGRGSACFVLDGKAARTDFRCLGHRPWGVHEEASLVEWRLETGRTHQIRRHAAAMGYPVVGDLVYGPPPAYTGHGLHLTCTRLEWNHPTTGDRMHVEVEPAKKMRRVLPRSFHALTPSPYLHFFEPR